MKIIHVGIDPGKNTGMAVVEDGKYYAIRTCTIVEAMLHIVHVLDGEYTEIHLHVENPNFRKYFGNTGREKLQGAGSIKRDYSIWQEFADHHRFMLHPVSPASIGSEFDNEAVFKAATGWTAKTSVHARDAAKILFPFVKK